MGVEGFKEFVSDRKKEVCIEACVKGKLIVDGYALHHHLYDVNGLDWENEGRYARQCYVSIEYFKDLKKVGITPIVLFDGGGGIELFREVLERRKKTIAKLPDMIRKKHLGLKTKRIMPLMAREIFVSTLREEGIDVYVTDGKAMDDIVHLANYYKCPVLVGNPDFSDFYVCNVTGGVIFFENLDLENGKAVIYDQSKFAECFHLPNPDLMCAVWAILGDNSLYHEIRREIENTLRDIDLNNRSYILNVLNFLQRKKIASFGECKVSLFDQQNDKYLENCEKVEKLYSKFYSELNSQSIEEFCASTQIRPSKPSCELHRKILGDYRKGIFPVIAINAMTLGELILEHCVGDQDQPPTSTLGLPVRKLIYGLVSNLMDPSKQACIKEHHPSNDGNLEYKVREVTPTCDHEELMVTELYCKGDKTKRALAVQTICEVLCCPETVVQTLDDSDADRALILVTLVTRCWAKHFTAYSIDDGDFQPEQLIKALIVNFFLNLSAPDANRHSDLDKSLYNKSHWKKVYHALLVWKSLYRNVHSLNVLLCEPLQPQCPYYLFDGPLVIFLALHKSPKIIDCYVSQLSQDKKMQCQKLFELIIV